MNLCVDCKTDEAVRSPVCGPARLCGHQASYAGNAYCHECATAKNVCVRCGASLDPTENDPPNIVRGID